MFDRLRNSRVARLAVAVNERYGTDAGGYLASAIAFYGFLSLFPLLLLGLAIVGFVLAKNPDLQQRVAGEVAGAVPGLEALIGENIEAVVDSRAGAGLIGLVGLLWTGTGVVAASRNALQQVFRLPRITGLVKQRLWLVLTTIWLGAAALVTTGVASVVGGIEASGPGGVALLVLVPIVSLALDVVLFLVAYRVLLRRELSFGSLLPGAVFAAFGWTMLKVVGAWYASRTLTNSSAVYGTFAAAVAALLILYLAARLFVYGAELNAVLIEEERGGDVMERSPDGARNPAREVPQGAAGPPEDRSTPELVRTIGTDLVDLVRKEVELAKQEVREGIAARVKGAAALAVGGVLGLFALAFLASAGAWALDLVLPAWAARLIVGGTFLLLAVVAAAVGARSMRAAPMTPERTKETLKEDVEWARAQLKR